MARDRVAVDEPPRLIALVALGALATGTLQWLLQVALGPLPTGAGTVAWLYFVAATFAGLALSHGQRRKTRALVLSYIVVLVAVLLTLATWIPLFYGSGTYVKGGYERLRVAAMLHVVCLAMSALIAPRLLPSARLRQSASVAIVAPISLLVLALALVFLLAQLRASGSS